MMMYIICQGRKGGGGGSTPPKIFRIFLKSEGKELERKRKKMKGNGGGGLIQLNC